MSLILLGFWKDLFAFKVFSTHMYTINLNFKSDQFLRFNSQILTNPNKQIYVIVNIQLFLHK